jgi:hypothetical protein
MTTATGTPGAASLQLLAHWLAAKEPTGIDACTRTRTHAHALTRTHAHTPTNLHGCGRTALRILSFQPDDVLPPFGHARLGLGITVPFPMACGCRYSTGKAQKLCIEAKHCRRAAVPWRLRPPWGTLQEHHGLAVLVSAC